MPSTEFYSTGLGYVLKWGDDYDAELLTVEVSQLRQRGGSPYALVTTSSTIQEAHFIPGAHPRVLNSEVFLLNANSRATYAAELERLIPNPEGATRIEYRAVLEELAQRVINAENKPVEFTTLDLTKMPKPLPWLVEGYLPSQKPTILYGAGGVGKSIFAAAMATAVVTGQRFLQMKTTKTDVLYLDWETDEADIARRVRLAQMGLDPSKEPTLKYAAFTRPMEEHVDQIAKLVAEQKIGLVIIDSVGMALGTSRDGSDPSETAIRFFRALRALNAAVLAIDHVSGEDMRRARGAAKPYGSVYKWNSARNALELREDAAPDGNGVHLVLKHRKSNLGARMSDLFLNMVWGEDEVTFTKEKMRSAAPVGLAQRILDILTTGPADARKLADLLTDDDTLVTEAEVRHVLKALVAGDKVTIILGGDVRLT